MPKKIGPAVKERCVRQVLKHLPEYPSLTAASSKTLPPRHSGYRASGSTTTVSRSAKSGAALALLTETSNQLACVLDEHGGFAGVLTGEDLAEELVGEITDEHDPLDELAVTEEGGGWLMSGALPLDEVERSLGCDLPRDDYETLAGLAIAEYGALPPVGSVVTVELPLDPTDLADADERESPVLRLEVLAVDRHVPSRLSVMLTPRTATEEENR